MSPETGSDHGAVGTTSWYHLPAHGAGEVAAGSWVPPVNDNGLHCFCTPFHVTQSSRSQSIYVARVCGGRGEPPPGACSSAPNTAQKLQSHLSSLGNRSTNLQGTAKHKEGSIRMPSVWQGCQMQLSQQHQSCSHHRTRAATSPTPNRCPLHLKLPDPL